MPNPMVTGTASYDGIWLVPYRNNIPDNDREAWIGGGTPESSAETSMDEFTIFNRAEELSQDGALHLDRGTIEGLLMDRKGGTATTWYNRLHNLINNQRTYSYILLVSSRYHPFRVKLHGWTKTPVIAGGPAWRVAVQYREVT